MLKYGQYYPFVLRIYRLPETLNNLELHHFQNDFYHKNNLNQMIEILLFYLALLLPLLLLLVLLSSWSKSKLFVKPEILYSLASFYSFIFASSTFLVDLL